jgi:hypothetical protein
MNVPRVNPDVVVAFGCGLAWIWQSQNYHSIHRARYAPNKRPRFHPTISLARVPGQQEKGAFVFTALTDGGTFRTTPTH